MSDRGGESLPEAVSNANGSEALFRTLDDLAAITSMGTGTILYNRHFAEHNSGLVDNLKAVALATTLGLRSVDRVRRDYLPKRSEPEAVEPGRALYVRAYRLAVKHMKSCRDSLQTNEDAGVTLGLYAGSVAMERLEHSFFSAHLLFQLKLRFEADVVSRLILEQIAWSVAVAPLDSHAEIDKKKPQRGIDLLKRLVSMPDPGHLYGVLSNSAHAGTSVHRQIFEVDEDDRGVVKHGVTDWEGSAATMLMLADLWVIAYEAVQHDHLPQLVSTDPKREYQARDDRPFLAEMRALLAEFETSKDETGASRS